MCMLLKSASTSFGFLFPHVYFRAFICDFGEGITIMRLENRTPNSPEANMLVATEIRSGILPTPASRRGVCIDYCL